MDAVVPDISNLLWVLISDGRPSHAGLKEADYEGKLKVSQEKDMGKEKNP